jgi:bifunctional non-homologous end joining protein LigD
MASSKAARPARPAGPAAARGASARRPLDEYRRKRDFAKSPEPSGRDTRARRLSRRPARFFCVQKHLASHLHYDFRLEHNGTLLSWAVPKGPSLDPAVKRLAMLVEDHPIDYGTFEGVIPEGYGAGIVMLWDRGTWTPEVEDVDRALAKGDLKFTLDGYKLKGSWVLVRTRGYSRRRDIDRMAAPSERSAEGRSWLLIKHRDDWSGDLDIAEFAPLSVKTERDFPEILADDTPDIWRTNRPVEGGETGAMLRSIIEQAVRIKSERAGPQTARTPSRKRR